jgi:hypothetical protein
MTLSEVVTQLIASVKHLVAVGTGAGVEGAIVLPHVAAILSGAAKSACASMGTVQRSTAMDLGSLSLGVERSVIDRGVDLRSMDDPV